MTDVAVLEFGNELARVKVPDLDRPVVTCADESTSSWVEKESTNKHIVTRESSNAFTPGGGPDFDLAVVRAGDDQVILQSGVTIEEEG